MWLDMISIHALSREGQSTPEIDDVFALSIEILITTSPHPAQKYLNSSIIADKIEDKLGNPIEEGDTVFTKLRGSKRESEVNEIVTSEAIAKEKEKDVKNPPKVLFKDQHGHDVAHNPGTLENLDRNTHHDFSLQKSKYGFTGSTEEQIQQQLREECEQLVLQVQQPPIAREPPRYISAYARYSSHSPTPEPKPQVQAVNDRIRTPEPDEAAIAELSHLCPLCDAIIQGPVELLDAHVSTHGIERPFMCPVPRCGHAYKQKRNLWRHNRDKHLQMQHSLVDLVCPIYGLECAAVDDLNDHLMVHDAYGDLVEF
ncbi:uncharacterized protein PAC_13082 [Phialocephala subalpina]|uniref:C2H2-type domain-containing protein n=1 Tax=Phialocephala subalpina TaxID=576137 RepID=A0A1L7XDT3_9HELO|nr:uncharacterized protein PAC_13082 [Phialocephala subalpina]